MARRPPAPVDTRRKLVLSKIWNGEIWSPGQEDVLPADFPQDGPHWDDYVEEPRPAFDPNRRAAPTMSDEELEILERADEILAQRQAEQAEQDRLDAEEHEKRNDPARLPKAAPKQKATAGRVTQAVEREPGDPDRAEMSHRAGPA